MESILVNIAGTESVVTPRLRLKTLSVIFIVVATFVLIDISVSPLWSIYIMILPPLYSENHYL